MLRRSHRLQASAPAAVLASSVVFAAATALAWDPLPVHNDPLVRMPGSQPTDGIVLESPGQCGNCHGGFDAAIEPTFNWGGSMMAQATRDPLFWASMTVAAQDSIWALGRPNAADLCLRCHTPTGWLGHRSEPSNGSALAGTDFDGVSCDMCHSMADPFFESTFAGTREGSDWTGYWDEATSLSASSAIATRDADRSHSSTFKLFNGTALYGAGWAPRSTLWTENGGGQYFVNPGKARRASFADANAKHSIQYSRYHKSRFFCATCHDVSNSALANLNHGSTLPGDGTTVLPSEQLSASGYGHIERTFSEFMLSDYGTGAGSEGIGPFAPGVFTTSQPGNKIASCQDCHMPARVGVACNKQDAILRPTGSSEHPNSGQPLHDLTGGNILVPTLLASTVVGSAVYDATNAALLRKGPSVLTLDFTQGEPMDAAALLKAAERARGNLENAASITLLTYNKVTGSVSFRIQNNTGHKLISGYPEGRRMFINIRLHAGGSLVHEINPYDYTAGTLRGLDPAESPSSPPLTNSQAHIDDLVYEMRASSSLTGQQHTFHVALSDARYKDNRIPPKGFRINEAASRQSEPYWHGQVRNDYFSAAEYAGGYDDVQLVSVPGADAIQVRLFYQTTSREYIEFLRDEINGAATSLPKSAYVAQTDPFFAGLRAWGDTIWQLWDRNKGAPGAAPVLMTEASTGAVGDPCAAAGTDGQPCDDGNECTLGDACFGGTCASGAAVVCAAPDDCHQSGTCNPLTGQCLSQPKQDGATCDDGDECTTVDRCAGGVCVGSDPVVCSGVDEQCVEGICIASTDAGVDASLPEAGQDADDEDAAEPEAGSEAGGDGAGGASQDASLDAWNEADASGGSGGIEADADNDAAVDDVWTEGAQVDSPQGTGGAGGASQDASLDAWNEADALEDDADNDAAVDDAWTEDAQADSPQGTGGAGGSTDAAGWAGAGASAGAAGNSEPGAPLGSPSGDDGGCSCRTQSRGTPPFSAGLAALAALGFGLRRRRR